MMVQEVPQREGLPYPIGLQRIICYGDLGLYLIGGATYTGSKSSPHHATEALYNAQMYKFNLSTMKWKKMSPIKPSFSEDDAALVGMKGRQAENTNIVLVSRCAAFLDKHRLMIAGGRLLADQFNLASFATYVYDVESQTTTEVSSTTTTTTDAGNEIVTRLPTDHRDFFDQTLVKWRNTNILCSRILDDQTGKKRFMFHQQMLYRRENLNGDEEGIEIGWKKLCPITSNGPLQEPIAGDLCELAIYGDHIYCIDKNDREQCLDVQWRYGLFRRRWERVETRPDPYVVDESNDSFTSGKPVDRMLTSCVTYGDFVYVVGGSCMSWAGPKVEPVLSDIWRLHLPTLQWSRMPARLPQGLWFHAVDVSPSGYMYVFGGFTDLAGRKQTQNLWRVYLDGPPLLSSLCWRMILKATDYTLEEKNEDELRELRVPRYFVCSLKW